ncbi:hypothetical protein ACWFNE_19370 [Cellulomonas sp. NPDC055163]
MTRPTTARPARTVLVSVLVAAALGGCGAPDSGPEPDPTESVASGSGATTPTVAPTPTPSPTAAPAALAFHPEGRVGDLPANAPEAQVVELLTARLGAAPETTDAEYACKARGEAGRVLAWPGLRVLVLVADPEGGATDPYVGGWAMVVQDGTDPAVTTPEGLRTGDPGERVAELYPGSVDSPRPNPALRSWQTAPAPGYTVVTADDGSGAKVGAIGSGYVCQAP